MVYKQLRTDFFPKPQNSFSLFRTHVKVTGASRQLSLHDLRPGPACRAQPKFPPPVMEVACIKNAACRTLGNKFVLFAAARVGMSLGGQTYIFRSPRHRGSISPTLCPWCGRQKPRIKRFRTGYDGPWSPLPSKCGKTGKQQLLILLLIPKKEVLAAPVRTEENITNLQRSRLGHNITRPHGGD